MGESKCFTPRWNCYKRQDRVYFRGQWRYPKELHNSHNKLPFLAERIKIGKVEKLEPNLKDKMTYKVHIKNVNQSLKHDRKFNKKVHWVICFEHSSWIRRLLMLNTKLRTSAKNGFEEDFFNLLNNRIFSKAIENTRSHMLREKHCDKKVVIRLMITLKMGIHFRNSF